jgi:hypothetical protein
LKFRIVTEYDPETKSFAAYCPELPGCCSAGDTEEEALENTYLEPVPIRLKRGKKIHEVELPSNARKAAQTKR